MNIEIEIYTFNKERNKWEELRSFVWCHDCWVPVAHLIGLVQTYQRNITILNKNYILKKGFYWKDFSLLWKSGES